MRKDFKKGVDVLKGVRLTKEENLQILENIARQTGVDFKSVKSPYFNFGDRLMFRRSYSYILASFLVVMCIGATTTYAAQGSLPGDILYPVKIHVNELVRGALTFGAEAEASWQNEKINTRIQEAEQLANQGKLNNENSQEIQTNINESSNDLNQNITNLSKNNANKANNIKTDFALSADINAKALNSIVSNSDTETKKEIDSIKNTLIQAAKKVTDSNLQGDSNLNTENQNLIETKINLEQNSSEIQNELKNQTDQKLNEINSNINSVKNNLGNIQVQAGI